MIRRKPTAKPLSELLPGVLKTSLENHGLATSQIITRWREIAGEDLAEVTRPLRINWPRRRAEEGALQNQMGATLVLQVEPAFALDVQHEAPLILQRVNALYGWVAVSKITLRQGPVKKEEKIHKNQRLTEYSAKPVTGIADESLRRALQKLGGTVEKTQKN